MTGPPTERWVIDTHIPEAGPLTPAAVDESFARAEALFARHFADHPATELHCRSWLLDPYLAEVLPADSNLVRFQRRWELYGEPEPGDHDAVFFVFRRRDVRAADGTAPAGHQAPARRARPGRLGAAVAAAARTHSTDRTWSLTPPTVHLAVPHWRS